jgi:hypothetical protein
MKSMFHAALILAVSGTAAMTAAPPASAQVVSFHVGDVAIAYQDGYWDNHHVWHAWQRDSDLKTFRNQHPEHYRDYNHDRDDHHDH